MSGLKLYLFRVRKRTKSRHKNTCYYLYSVLFSYYFYFSIPIKCTYIYKGKETVKEKTTNCACVYSVNNIGKNERERDSNI